MKNLNIIFSVLLILITNSLVNAQSWTIYQADEDPITEFVPAFEESNTGGVYERTQVPDPDDASNNLLRIVTDQDTDASSDNYQLRQRVGDPQPTTMTVVFRAKGNDPSKVLLFDMDMDFNTFRSQIRILTDGTLDVANGTPTAAPDPLTVNTQDWNIYRFTRDGDQFALYINEDATPVVTGTGEGGRSNNYFRFGDGWGSSGTRGVSTDFDWVTWDYTGAYSPDQSPLPDELVDKETPLGDWTIYNADVEPADFIPAFSESNGAGTYVIGTLPDTYIPNNNLLSIKTDDDPLSEKDNIQLRQYTDEDAVTVVLKTRTVDIANKGLLFDMDFRSLLSTRFAIKVLNDGTYDIDKGGDGIVPDKGDWGFDATEWNIFRFTKNGNDVNIYINEDPTPVFTMTAVGTADGSGYWRFGDGWTNEDVDSQFDWVSWDYSGAYAPSQTRLPDDLVKPPLGDWTIYQADEEPADFVPAFSESNGAGTYTFGTLVDPDDATNNLLSIKTDDDPLSEKDNIQLRQYTDEDAVTVVLKARTVDIANKGLLFDLDFRSLLSTRFAIKVLNDGTYDIDKGGDGIVPDKDDWGFDATEWNIFRFTKDGAEVNIYINEDPTPVFTLSAVGSADGNGYWRFGDGWTNEDVDSQFDWVTWDYSGAYAPDQARLPDELLGIIPDVPEPTLKVLGSVAGLSQDLGLATDFTIGSYKLSGTDLTDDITVTPPENFEVSVDSMNWFTNVNPLVIAPTDGMVEDTVILVRLNASVVGDYSGDISNTSPGAEEELLSVGGTAVDLIPEITLTGTLEAFVQNISTPSSSQSYRVSGINLKDSITVTAPTGYEVSADNVAWGTAFKIGPNDRAITNAFVYVRQFASAIGSISDSVSHTSPDALEVKMPVKGEVIPDPGITIEGDFTEFSHTVGTPSVAQSYTISGSSLTSNIDISLPENFEISVDKNIWLNSLTLAPLDGVVETMTLFVRLNANAKGTYSGDIIHSSIGVDDVSKAVSGTVDDAILAIPGHDDVAFAIWPNPTSDKITFQRERESGEAKLSLYSIQGNLINQYNVRSGSKLFEFDIRDLESGVYIIGYEGDGKVFTQRLIKE